jgi:hypothetical protein
MRLHPHHRLLRQVFDCPTSSDIVDYLASTHPAKAAALAGPQPHTGGAAAKAGAPAAVQAPAALTHQGLPAQLPGWSGAAADEAVFVAAAAYRMPGGALDSPASGALQCGHFMCGLLMACTASLPYFNHHKSDLNPKRSTSPSTNQSTTGLLDRPTVVPLTRWDVDAPVPDPSAPTETHNRFGSFLSPWDVEWCDAKALGLTPAEALLVDPQQRLLMDAFQEAHSGVAGSGLASR